MEYLKMDGDNRQRVVNPGLEFQPPGQTGNKWQVPPAQAQAQAQVQPQPPQPEMGRTFPAQIQLEVARAQKKARTHLTRKCGYPLPLKPLQPLQPHIAQVSKVPDFLFPTHQPILFFRPDPRPQFNSSHCPTAAFSASTSANSHGDQQPYPTTHPTEKPEAQLKFGDSLTYIPSSTIPSLFYTPPSTPSRSPPTANISFQQPPHHRAVAPGVVVNGNSSALNTPRPGPTTTPATPVNMPNNDPAPSGALRSPPEGIFSSFEDLIGSIQRVAKDQGFGIVKLRASNYRDHKPTRYDLVCDRGGVKYNSTAKKRNPSTRKVDCPWRAKAVCEVQLGNQWRFQVQCDQHNHEPRVHSSNPGQENTPTAQSIRSLTNKMDRMSHEMTQAFDRIEQRLDGIEKRIETMESRMGAVEARMSSMETRGTGMDVPMDNMEMGEPMLDGTVM